MGDDVGPLVFDGGYHAVGILRGRSPTPTELMDTCYAHIHQTIVEWLKVEGALGIEDVEFGADEQSHSVHLAGYDMGVAEIDWAHAAWYGGGMVSDAKYLESFLGCCRCHFLQGGIGMAAGYGVGVDV